ncbi:glycosyltransferase family 2 protein [Paenibacillus sp. 19GGS1-52]|uniref:glycosyltransferase family 2 protein n=1 Tax=Paenibacillus sp. 19GGS1-52 TaxID=2758563 RepID=UPI001EFBB2D1|nr:glycosyltransferase family A protein [Paenibacillus sp. 19GGS1-52]ULO07367.1 glycosyltransferase family 2 protein [Paenibacillus sp. 19GGS1-52]
MDHSERLQQTCYELLQQLNDDVNNSRPHVVDCAEVLDRCQTLIHNEANPQVKQVLETLSEVIGAYFLGRIAESALLYYLSEQFKIRDEDIHGLAKGLLELKSIPESKLPSKAASSLTAYPKISVIITTYNRKAFLHKAIKSILLQDYPHKEITVIDDCSTDGTDVLMKISYGDEPRVIYMRNESNSGPGNNRRKAFAAHADGEYILFLDDDDYLIDMNYLSKAVEFHRLHPEISFVAANVFLEYSQSKQLKVSSLQLSEIIRKHDYFMNFEQNGYPKPASTLTTIFKRKALIQMDILNMNMVNDASIYLRSLLIGDAGFIDVIAGVYRIHGNNITFNLSQGFLIENLEEKMLIRNMAIEQYGYGEQEMNEWFNHNVYDTISYYLMNSAKTHTDFQYMYTWAHQHCPHIYNQLRNEFRIKFMKKQLLRVAFVRSLLNRS